MAIKGNLTKIFLFDFTNNIQQQCNLSFPKENFDFVETEFPIQK